MNDVAFWLDWTATTLLLLGVWVVGKKVGEHDKLNTEFNERLKFIESKSQNKTSKVVKKHATKKASKRSKTK